MLTPHPSTRSQMLLFWSTLWAGKFSLLVFFRRMVLGLPKYLNIFWVVFGLVLITYLGCMASNFLTCKPLHKYWSSSASIRLVHSPLSIATVNANSFFPAGCSDPANVERADKSIKFATGADISADFLSTLLPQKMKVIVPESPTNVILIWQSCFSPSNSSGTSTSLADKRSGLHACSP